MLDAVGLDEGLENGEALFDVECVVVAGGEDPVDHHVVARFDQVDQVTGEDNLLAAGDAAGSDVVGGLLELDHLVVAVDATGVVDFEGTVAVAGVAGAQLQLLALAREERTLEVPAARALVTHTPPFAVHLATAGNHSAYCITTRLLLMSLPNRP